MSNKEFHIGFTGTQFGMTTKQRVEVVYFLRVIQIEHKYETIYAHHGDCIGSDFEFHNIVKEHNISVILHPPIVRIKRAFCNRYIVSREPKPYLERNHDIVDESDIMIATPQSKEEVLRSGTWATVRYARKIDKPLIVMEP